MFAATNTVANHSPNSLAATNAVAIRLDPFGVHYSMTIADESAPHKHLWATKLPLIVTPIARWTASLHRLAH